MAYGTPSFKELGEMRRVFGAKGASESVVSELSSKYGVDRDYVALVAESMRTDGEPIGGEVRSRALITESAPPGDAAGRARVMIRAFETHGSSPTIIRKLAQNLNMAESEVAKVAAVVEASGAKTAIAESGETFGTGIHTATTTSAFQMESAQRLKDQVESAEAKPLSQATWQELEALAQAYTA